MSYLIILNYAQIYVIISISFLIINTIIAGYKGEMWTWVDFRDSLFWPLSLATLTGLLIRVLVQVLSNRKTTKN